MEKINYLSSIKKNLPLVVLAVAIALFPIFTAGKLSEGKIIELRVEDFLLLFFGLVWLADFFILKKTKIKKPLLFLPILFWLGISFASLLVNLIIGNTRLDLGFFYFLKEAEIFFLYFFVFSGIKSIKDSKFLVNIWILLGALNTGYVFYQIFTGNQMGEYSQNSRSNKQPRNYFFNIAYI